MFATFVRLKRRLLFAEADSLVAVGRERILQDTDVLPLPEDLNPRSSPLDPQKINWGRNRDLIWSLLKLCRPVLTGPYLLYLGSILCGLLSPILVNHFIGRLTTGVEDDRSFAIALALGVGLGVVSILRGLLGQHFFYRSLRVYQMVNNLLNERIFRHALRLTQAARLKTPVGDVVNHMSSDSEVVSDFGSMVLPDLIATVLTVLGVSGLLFFYLGWSAIPPLLLMAALAPATKLLARRFTHLDEVMMQERDKRVTLMAQILGAIRVVKSFVWERSVRQEVSAVREREVAARKKMARAEVISGVAYVSVSAIVLFIALAFHAWRGFDLSPALVFTCVSLFGLLEEPFGGLSRLISRWTNSFVSAQRISDFLKNETLPESERELPLSPESSLGLEVGPLRRFGDFRLQVRAGESVALVGPVGGGKSSFLLTLLGEWPEDQSQAFFLDSQGRRVQGRTAYVPQEAYIVNGSLEDNLLFGLPSVEGETLRQAVFAANFEKDLQELPAGLRTEIGEKGVNLSGGQKQRVGLARAFLHQPQVVFLDDPLSAVDVETEEKICDRLIFGAWARTTRIVATHRLEFLSKFDRILFIEDARISAQGSYAELLANSEGFRAFVREHEKTQEQAESLAVAEVATVTSPIPVQQKESRITEDEDRETGAVKGSVYGDYLKSLGGDPPWRAVNLALLFLGACSVMLMPLAQRWWLGLSSSYQQEKASGPVIEWLITQGLGHWVDSPLSSVLIYGLLGLVTLGLSLLNGLWWLERGIQAGQRLHDRMLDSILRTGLRFFDSTPVGRILQRFSRDVESVDLYLQWSFDSAIHCLIEVILSLVLIVTLLPQVLWPMAPVLVFYYILQRDYRRPAREAKRLDAIARSPRYAHFKETLTGLPVIRGFGRQDWFLESFFAKLQQSQRMFYNHYILNRWFSTRIPLVGGLIAIATTVAITFASRQGHLSPGTAGLLTIYALSFWGYLNWGIRIFADIESRMTSVERLNFYADLPSEKEVSRPLAQNLESWPGPGKIEFLEVKARYATHLPLVLKGVSFTVEAGERVGLIGRTGSGKTSLFQTLFRFIELEEGQIRIDGVDIASIPLEKLRRALAIIPQDPTLFLGTIRSNLDRYGEYTDQQIEEALRQASMWDFVSSVPEKLEFPVVENGLNLSQGQRQLLCLARALLCRARVVILDEATASVDVQTDATLQKVIRENLQGVTMLIIAHRLGTVADCDKVVELANGRVKGLHRPGEGLERLAQIEAEELVPTGPRS